MKIEVYGKENCPYCVRAKEWLAERNLRYTYTDVLKNLSIAELISLKEKYNMNTVPIVVINNELIGGYSELKKLDIPVQ